MRLAPLALLAAATLAGCGKPDPSAGQQTCDPATYEQLTRAVGSAPVHTIVFVDRSSTATDTTLRGPYLRALDATLARDFATAGSTLDLFLVHDRTTGKAGHASARLDAALPPSSDNAMDLKAACDAAHNAFVRSKVTGRVQALQFARTAPAAEENRDGSDLWGALQVVSETVAQDPDATGLRVLFLSDMMQCMPGRCLENTPPGSAQQAEAWGRADAAQIEQSLRLDKAALAKGTYSIVSGDFANRDAYTYIPAYWRALLGALGVPDGNVSFN